MRADSRHGLSRPDRARGGANRPSAPRPGGRRGADAAELEALLEPIMRAAGMDLESVRVGSAGRRRLLRVVVDADGGVSLDDIALVSREVSARLDATGAMGEAPYTLEVSSPGVDRPLTLPRHWRRAVGRLVRVPLAGDNGASSAAPSAEAVGETGQAGRTGRDGQAGGAAPIEGRVIAAGDSGVILEVGGEQREFGFADLGPGRVQVEFGPPGGGPGGQDTASAAAATGPQTGGRGDGH
jgi:ribosome maturation factor RimP